MTSPSVRSTNRSTPCVLGCCGPMLTSISSVRTSNSMTVWSGFVTVAMGSLQRRLYTANRISSRVLAEKLLQNLQFIGGGVLPQPIRVKPEALEYLAVQDS